MVSIRDIYGLATVRRDNMGSTTAMGNKLVGRFWSWLWSKMARALQYLLSSEQPNRKTIFLPPPLAPLGYRRSRYKQPVDSDTDYVKTLFVVKTKMEHRAGQPPELSFEEGDMIAVTKFKESEPYWSGIRLPKDRLDRWWDKILAKDANTYEQGTFPRDLVALP